MASSGETRSRILSSSLKCLNLLTLLSQQGIPMSLGHLAERSGLPKGTVHQQLRTLMEAGYVIQNPGGSYQVALSTITLGTAALEQANLGSQIAARVASLAARSGETASLSVLRDGQVFILYRVTIDSSLMTDLAAGRTMPASSSASGQVLRAFESEVSAGSDPAAAAGASAGVEGEAVAEIRKQGYAVISDEFLVGMTTIAVPVRLPGIGLAALSLAAPTFRFDQEKLLALLTRSRVL